MGIRISGVGSYLPSTIMTNADLSHLMPTTHEWIVERTGIEQRHFVEYQDITTFELGVHAAKKALLHGNLQGKDIDAILVATSTPDQIFPATAVHIQREIEASCAFAFDIQAVCAGFIYAISMARSLLLTGQAQRVLVVGAEKYSSLLDFSDRSTAILFGDGAGAVILENTEVSTDCGASWLKSDGQFANILHCTPQNIHMDGKDVFKNGIRFMADAIVQILTMQNMTIDDIDFLIPHQANLRIIEGIAQKLGLSLEKVVITVQKHGNTSAASIPLAFDEAIRDGRIQRGHRVLFVGLGAGLAWGSFLLTY